MFNPERAKWSAEQFKAEFDALNRDLIHESNPDWDYKQIAIAQLMNEIGLDFLECYEMVCGEWVPRKDGPAAGTDTSEEGGAA